MNLHKSDIVFIQKTISKVKREELKHRMLFPIDSEFDPNATEIGFDIYDISGTAIILAHGGNANNIPFVGESKERQTQLVYTIATGIKYTEGEIEGVASQRANGKGGTYNLKSERPATARRFVYEKECLTLFAGNSKYGILGVFNAAYYGTGKGTKENVAGVDAAARLWSGKTAPEILADIQKAVTTAMAEGIGGDMKMTIVVPFAQWRLLNSPFSTDSNMTIMDWIKKSEDVDFAWYNGVKATNNDDTVDYLFCYPKDKKVLANALIRDIKIGKPVYDILEGSEQAVTLKTGGIMIKHPCFLYVGKGI